MTILKYDFIYSKIIKILLNHDYKYLISNITKSDLSIWPIPISFLYKNFQILKLSLVSKKWNQEVSRILTNEIINFHNYYLFNKNSNQIKNDSLDLTSPLTKELDEDNYKLIKNKNSVKIYNSLEGYENDYKNGITSNFRKIMIDLPFHGENLITFLNSDAEFPDNVEFSIYLYAYNDNFLDLFNLNLSKKKIYKIYIQVHKRFINQNNRIQILEFIKRFNSKKIILNFYMEDDGDDSDTFYDHICNPGDLFNNSRLKQFEIKNDYFEPNYYLSINSNESNLKILSLQIPFNRMINIINGKKKNLNFFTHPLTLEKDYNEMINIIMNLKSLKYLQLFNFSHYCNEKIYGSSSCVTLGFKSLFSNPSCTIQSLELDNIDFIDDLFIDGLNLNTSISTLIIHNFDPSLIIEKVLTNNRTIKNIFYNAYTSKDVLKLLNYIHKINEQVEQQQNNNSNENSIFKILNIIKSSLQQQYNNKIELNSITISSYEINEIKLNQIINEIKNKNLNNIKEYNFYIFEKEYKSKDTQQILLSNGTVINIINNRKNKDIYIYIHK